MTTPLPARPQGIRTSPDGLTVAVLYDSLEHGRRWCAMTVQVHGAWIREVAFLAAEDVEGWQVWCDHACASDGGAEVGRMQGKTVQEVVDGLSPGTEVT